MGKEVLHKNTSGAEFMEQLAKKLHGGIVQLPDGRIQACYEFTRETELKDWRIVPLYKAAPEVREGGLAFGRVEPEETDRQWDRDIRLNLVLDPDPRADLEIDFDLSMGTTEPWSSAAWVLTRRDGTRPGTRFLYGVLTDWNRNWREQRDEDGAFKEGHLRGDFVMRVAAGDPEDDRWIAPPQNVPLADAYRMNITRHNRKLRWQVNEQTMGQTTLADDELCLTERLMFCNYGKGTGAVFGNVVIRSRIVDIDPCWPSRDTDGDSAQLGV